jgi:hypothetical protein
MRPPSARRAVPALQRLEARLTPTFGAVGPEFRANEVTLFDQLTPESARCVALDGDGDAVVVWVSPDNATDYGVYARRFTAAGPAAGGQFPVNTHTTGDQRTPAVAADADGDFVVVWQSYGQDGQEGEVYARRYDAVGAPAGGEFRVNTYTSHNQSVPAVAMSPGGEFVVAWSSETQDGSGFGVYARLYDAAGAPRGPEFRVNAFTVGGQTRPAVAVDGDGDFVVSWTSYNQLGGGANIFARRFAAAGAALTGEVTVTSVTTAEQRQSSVACDADGDFVVAWHGDMDANSYGVYARRFTSAGLPSAPAFQANTFTVGSQVYPSVAADADGDFVIAWASVGQDGSGWGVYARRYVGGAAQGPEFRVNTYVNTNQVNISAAMDADGDFLAAWSSYYQDTSFFGVYAQRYQDADDNGDTAGPVAAAVYASGTPGPVTENRRLAPGVAGLSVTFSEVLSTAGGATGLASATNPANWALSRDGVDVSGQITAVGFTAGTRPKAVLTLAGPLGPGHYALTARAALRDLDGNGLDGDFDGAGPPSDFTRRFAVGPAVSVTVNDGAAQRSMVRSVTATFDEVVALGPGAFQLTGPGGPVALTVDTSGSTATQTVARLTFGGPGVVAGSLADGLYTFRVVAAQVTAAGGQPLDGDGDGTPGGDSVTPLHRLFGDADGDRDVDATDFGAFRAAFGSGPSAFDFNGDNDTDASDFGQFRQRFGTSV